MLKETISNITFYFIVLCWCEIQHHLVILDYVDISLWNIHPSIVKHFSIFAFSWECAINILLYYFVEKGHEALLSLHFSRPQKKKNKMCQQYIYSFRHFYVSSAFSPCVFRIKIRFCQFSLQGKNKKAKWYCQTTKCFLIYNPYFINKD